MENISVKFKMVGIVVAADGDIDLTFQPGTKLGKALEQLLDICGDPLREFYDEETGKNYLTFLLRGKTVDVNYEMQDGDVVTVFQVVEGG